MSSTSTPSVDPHIELHANKKLNKYLLDDKSIKEQQIKILLLGAGECGRDTEILIC